MTHDRFEEYNDIAEYVWALALYDFKDRWKDYCYNREHYYYRTPQKPWSLVVTEVLTLRIGMVADAHGVWSYGIFVKDSNMETLFTKCEQLVPVSRNMSWCDIDFTDHIMPAIERYKDEVVDIMRAHGVVAPCYILDITGSPCDTGTGIFDKEMKKDYDKKMEKQDDN